MEKVRKQEEDQHVARARALARWLDDRFVDPLVGLLLPGVGDLATAPLGLYIVAIAVRRRLPPIVIARMLLNLGIDALIGVVPLAGDLFDFVFKAQTRNLRLLEARPETGRSRPSDWLVVLGAALLLGCALALPILLMRYLIHALAGS